MFFLTSNVFGIVTQEWLGLWCLFILLRLEQSEMERNLFRFKAKKVGLFAYFASKWNIDIRSETEAKQKWNKPKQEKRIERGSEKKRKK